MSHWDGFRVALPALLHSAFFLLHSPRGGFGWPFPAFRGSKLDVGGWMFGVHHKESEYKRPSPPPSGWSGGTMVPPWYRPIQVEHSQRPIFDQPSLSKARKPIAETAAKRRKSRKRDGNRAFSCAFCAFSRLFPAFAITARISHFGLPSGFGFPVLRSPASVAELRRVDGLRISALPALLPFQPAEPQRCPAADQGGSSLRITRPRPLAHAAAPALALRPNRGACSPA